MIKDEYSPYKIVHRLDKLIELKKGLQPDPVQIHLVPTNRCNQSCNFCAYRLPESACNQNFTPHDFIPREKLLEIIDSCKNMGVNAIQITGGGEPLIHPNIKEAITKIINADIGLGLVTNGQALDDELIEMLSDISWIRISVDASNRDTYSLIRKVKADNYEKLMSNIGKLVNKKGTTTLGIGFVVNRENYREIYDACKMFKEIGVDNFRISASFNPLGIKYFDGIHDDAKKLSERAKAELEDQKFTVFNLFNDRIIDLFHGKQDYDFCPMKELVPYVAADLSVYTCCILSYNENGYIGSIKDRTFEELWHSEEKIQSFKRHNPRKNCQLPCMFEAKNHFINYCIKTDARHVNFI